jgi:hypothetical protein
MRLWFLALVLSAVVSLVPFVHGLRQGRGAIGCGISLMLLLLAPLAVALEPSYIGLFRPWLECGTLTRTPVIVGIAPLLLLAGAAVLTLATREK